MIASTFIIAEAGVNHNGKLELALQLMDKAKEARVDAIKFQSFKAESLVIPGAEKADYQKASNSLGTTQFEMLEGLELSELEQEEIFRYGSSIDLKTFSTAFDIASLDFLEGMGQSFFKVPSGEITNIPYLRHIAKFGKPIFLSTGASNLGEIELALETIESSGLHRSNVTILHCTSDYPAKFSEVNLLAMNKIAAAFSVKVGYSDHTTGIEVPIAAVAMGATVIEKHFTLDKNLNGPDHKASLDPKELNEMVVAIRNIESAMGDGIKRPTLGEINNKNIIRKSIVATKPIKRGDILTSENISTKRPGSGLSAIYWDLYIGTLAKRDYSVNELLTDD